MRGTRPPWGALGQGARAPLIILIKDGGGAEVRTFGLPRLLISIIIRRRGVHQKLAFCMGGVAISLGSGLGSAWISWVSLLHATHLA